MRQFFTLLLLFSFWANWGVAQNAKDVPEAVRFIKLGNTLRAVDKPQQAIDILVRALPAVRGKDPYWEAVAYENLGLTYYDQENSLDAVRYFQKALDLYKQLNFAASETAMRELIGELNGSNLYAGIDIGASGVKLAIFRTKYENGFYTKDIKSKPDAPNVTLVSGTAQSFQIGRDVMKSYLDSINKYNIPKERIYIAFSSGINESLGKMPGQKRKLYEQLIALAPTRNLRIDTTLTAAREAELFTVGSVPRRVWQTTSCMDFGSGNIKGGYFDANKNFHAISFPLGTKSLVLQIEKKGSLDLEAFKREAQKAVKAIADTSINVEFNTGHVGLQQRKTVALGGGITWALVSYLYPDKANMTAVPITIADVERFRSAAQSAYQVLTNPDLTDIADPAIRAKAVRDVGNVQNQFNQKQIIAGSLLLEAVVKAYTNTAVGKRFVFIRDSDIGWVTGKFLESINREYEQKIAAGGR